MTISFPALRIDLDEGCLGTEFIFKLGKTLANLSDLAIESTEMELVRGSCCVTITRQLAPVSVDSESSVSCAMRGIAKGTVRGRLWFRLSDGQHRPSEDFEFQVLP